MTKPTERGAPLSARQVADNAAVQEYLRRLPASKNERLAFLTAYLDRQHELNGGQTNMLVIRAWNDYLDWLREKSLSSCVAPRKMPPRRALRRAKRGSTER